MSKSNEYIELKNHNDWRRDWPYQFEENIVITPRGLFMVQRLGKTTYCRPANALFRSAGGVELPARVPSELLFMAVAFFRTVLAQYNREDILLLYRKDYQYSLVHPAITRAGEYQVSYEFPATPPGSVRAGSIHSHGAEPACHSHRDKTDDLGSPGVHIVLGNLNCPCPSVTCVYSSGAHCFEVDFFDVFDFSLPEPSFPEDWLVETPHQKSLNFLEGDVP